MTFSFKNHLFISYLQISHMDTKCIDDVLFQMKYWYFLIKAEMISVEIEKSKTSANVILALVF